MAVSLYIIADLDFLVLPTLVAVISPTATCSMTTERVDRVYRMRGRVRDLLPDDDSRVRVLDDLLPDDHNPFGFGRCRRWRRWR